MAERRPTHWSERLALFWGVASIAAVHGPLIGYGTFANVDEAYAGALASRILDGHKLYVGAVSQRGPLMYYLYTLVAWLHGWDNLRALRLWALAIALLNLYAVYLFARAFLPRAGVLIATFVMAYALAFGVPPFDGLALHGESLQLPPLTFGCMLGALALHAGTREASHRRWLLAGSGLLFGIAVAIKQSAALHPAALCVWLVASARRNGQPARQWLTDIAIVTAGTFLLPAAFIAHSAHEGTLKELYYYTVVYNRDVHLRPTRKLFPLLTPFFLRLTEQTGYFLLLVAIASAALPSGARRLARAVRARAPWPLLRGFGVRRYLVANLALAVLSASAMYRFFPHYFVQSLPFLALTAGAMVGPSAERARHRAAFDRLAIGAFGMLVGAAALGTIFGERVDGRVTHDRTPQLCGKLIAAGTKPDDRIFVWGFSPWIYQYAHRKPAGRFVFETYVTGFVPWFWDRLDLERSRIVPGSVEALLADLDRERPEIVVDAGSVMMARPMRAYEKPGRWLLEHYCFEYRLAAFDVYRRKPDGVAECAQPYVPLPYDAVNWNGTPMGIPLPLSADRTRERRLPYGNLMRPIWFPNGPPPRQAVLDAARDPKTEREEAEAERDGFYIPRFDGRD
ncbi:MAG TPA: glycosyltransferase family 39 protein [Polyangiaceae bacterium]|nr:glycosyltransferase family 39 protein [Polyangiaceae bacterium]